MSVSIRSKIPAKHRAPVNSDLVKITNQKSLIAKLQRENRLLTEAITKAQSSEEIAKVRFQKFASKVTHDLKAPLRHVNAYLAIIKDDCQQGKLNEETLRYMDTVTSAAKNIGGMIDAIRLSTRMSEQVITVEEVCLQREFELAVERVNDQYPGITWEVSNLPLVQTDLAMIRTIIHQLLDNAAKFSQKKESAVIRVSARQLPGFYEIKIEDNGIGFDPRNSFKLFEMFEKLHGEPSLPGKGVGLAIVDGLLEKLGGKISGIGEEGKGAVFTMRLRG